MGDIFETLYVRVCVVYGGHRLRTKSTSWVLISFSHEFRFFSPYYFDVEGRNMGALYHLVSILIFRQSFYSSLVSTGSYVCDINANCTKTDGSHNCTCREGYTGDGQSCQGIIFALDWANIRIKPRANKKKNLFPQKLRNIMLVSLSSNLWAIHFCPQMSLSVAMATMFAMLIPTVTTQMVLIFVPAKKDTLEMDSHVKVNKSNLHYLKQAALNISYRSWKLAHVLETCFHAPLWYFY